MVKVNPLQPAFNAGEFGPRLAARVDFAKYQNAGTRVENMLPLPQGGLMRRPGTRYIAGAADNDVRPRLIPFEFSTEQAYVIEAGDEAFRFFRNKGQIVVADTDAAISNGTFDSDISDWDDVSTGSASVSWTALGTTQFGTLDKSEIVTRYWGDRTADRRYFGLQFTAPEDGSVASATIVIGHPEGLDSFDAVAKIYTDNAGNPGTQVGNDSATVSIDAADTFKFTFTTPPSISGSTTYWLVLSDETGDGTGRARVSLTSAQTGFASGAADTITSIGDATNLSSNEEIRAELEIVGSGTNGLLTLEGDGTDVAAAEQDVTTTATGTEHALAFQVIGAPGDKIKVRVGTTSEGNQILEDLELSAGWHVVAFTPTASPFYVGFRNEAAKDIYIDNVSLLDDQALALATPYGEADLAGLKWSQSADVMYFTHPSCRPYKLERRGHTTWSLVEVAFQDGPWLEENATATTLTPSATSGNGITISASAADGINDGAGFSTDDLGRLVRLHPSGEPGWAVITEIVSPTQVRADVKRDFAASSATTDWRLGAWSDGVGWPSVMTFFEQRTAWANTSARPQSFWMSQSGDIENMRPDSFEDNAVEVQEDDGLDFTIASDKVNAIHWMNAGRQLLLGTSGGEWSVASDGPVVTPDDIQVQREATNGSANIQPIRISSIVLFIQRAKRKLKEFVYSFETDGFRAPDLTILADHVLTGGVREIAYKQEPDSQVFAVREDGVLPVLTYRREEEVVGWSRLILGGSFGSGDPVVESVAVIPGNETNDTEGSDECWVAVKRTIDGGTVRYIECFEEPFEGPAPDEYDSQADFEEATLAVQEEAFYVDSGLIYDGSSTSTLTGLDHLEGETVKVWGNGEVLEDAVVASGQITTSKPVTYAVVGLGYRHVFRSLKLAFGAAAGTAVGKVKRIHAVSLVLLHSLGLRCGRTIAALRDIPLRSSPTLFTGEVFFEFEGEFDRDPRIVISGDDPAPLHILAMAPEQQTNEMK